MKAAGIAAEFNPFHNGHKALIDAARAAGATHVAAVMSGNYVQRGSLAVTDKRIRARSALLGGVDLVLELPLPYATATAQHFARGAVEILAAAGCVDMLCFGSESGDAALLERLSHAVESPELKPLLAEGLARGWTFAKARQSAVELLLGNTAGEGLSRPNNALAVEYLRAARGAGWQPELFTIPRLGSGHDVLSPRGGSRFASASYLRAAAGDFIKQRRFMPEACAEVLKEASAEGLYPADSNKLELAVLAGLRAMKREEFALLPDLSEGLENRLYGAVRQSVGLEELYAGVKTKRYTLARVRRLVLHAFLRVAAADVCAPVPYIRVLGFNQAGKELLGRIAKNSGIPVDARLVRLRETGEAAARFACLEERATDLYMLALPQPRPCGYELRASGVYLKS